MRLESVFEKKEVDFLCKTFGVDEYVGLSHFTSGEDLFDEFKFFTFFTFNFILLNMVKFQTFSLLNLDHLSFWDYL